MNTIFEMCAWMLNTYRKNINNLTEIPPPPHVKLNCPGSIVLKYYRKYNISTIVDSNFTSKHRLVHIK